MHRVFLNSWQLTCTAMRAIPGASALFPDTDLQEPFLSLKNISIHMTICLPIFFFVYFSTYQLQRLLFQRTRGGAGELCSLTHTDTKPRPSVGKSSAPRELCLIFKHIHKAAVVHAIICHTCVDSKSLNFDGWGAGPDQALRAEGVRPHGSSLFLQCTWGYDSLLHLHKLWPKSHLCLQKTSGLYTKPIPDYSMWFMSILRMIVQTVDAVSCFTVVTQLEFRNINLYSKTSEAGGGGILQEKKPEIVSSVKFYLHWRNRSSPL